MKLGNKEMLKEYEKLTDEKLAELAQKNDAEAEETLIRRYIDAVKLKGHLYFIVGADSEDVIQEGMIGLFKAIRDYSSNKEASFKTFAELCINRQILTAVKTASRMKHQPLNTSVSLNSPVEGIKSMMALEDSLVDDAATDPEAVYLVKDLSALIKGEREAIFSKFELKVLKEYMAGEKYEDIAAKFGKSYKAIDNAMQRVKKKIDNYMKN